MLRVRWVLKGRGVLRVTWSRRAGYAKRVIIKLFLFGTSSMLRATWS